MICVAIADISAGECLSVLKKAEFAEIRLDMVKFSEADMKKVFGSHSNLIATCRHGVFDDQKRAEILEKAISYGAAYVDVEVDSDEAYRNKMAAAVKSSGAKLIMSYHDFERTPSRDELMHIYNWCLKYNPDIVKIACRVNNIRDNARLLGLLDSENVPVIVIGMGGLGRVTRIAAPLLGGFCTFASYKADKKTADGQYTLDELVEIYKRLDID
ncbi:MAG: type I 3-dehydroquinate dehydratase [Oligoflexia bacterium]|nr:type I 3-dehydroquinate dehydratase [Oligoflexia bacterium]